MNILEYAEATQAEGGSGALFADAGRPRAMRARKLSSILRAPGDQPTLP